MANAMLDARQEGDSYRRIEVITGQSRGDGGRRRRRPGSSRRASRRAQHLRGGAAQRRCPWAALGMATSVCGDGAQQGGKLRAGADCRGER